MIATFQDTTIGSKLLIDEQIVIVTSKDTLRIELESVTDARKRLSLYGPEFDGREFEIVSVPVVKSTK